MGLAQFLTLHWAVLEATDFFTVEVAWYIPNHWLLRHLPHRECRETLQIDFSAPSLLAVG